MPEKDVENEWFARHESELIRQARRERERREREASSQQAEEKRALCWMKCPKCGSDLVEEKVGDVVVDRCSSCEGIFLDRGEVETLMLQDRPARRGFFRRLAGFD